MVEPELSIELSSPDETALAAQRLAEFLAPGDTILLQGPVGAGKSHFARHLIRSILMEPEDIPSPTFTLVQTYETEKGPLWHSDLYRISSTYEIEELGLINAFDDAICIVEWPDRLGELAPEHALSVELSHGRDENCRRLLATWKNDKWSDRTKGLANL